MFKFSKQFFVLFILVTVLPIFLMLLFNLYSNKIIDDRHIKQISELQEEMTLSAYKTYLKNEIKKKKQIISNLKNYNFSLNEYKNILDADNIFWLTDSNKLKAYVPWYKSNESDILGSYEVVKNNETGIYDLVTVIVIPLKVNEHKGLVVVKNVPMHELSPHRPPTMFRILAGDKVNTKNIIYFATRPKDIEPFEKHMKKDLKKFMPPKPPSRFVKLEGNVFPLKNANNKTIALIEIGIPVSNKTFMFLHNPMFSVAFESMYLIGLAIPILGIIFTILVGYYLKKHYINPIEDLSKVTEQFSKGNLDIRVCAHVKQQELRNTLLNFNRMLDSIQEKEELKENFITNLTHDFRTPLIAENITLVILLNDKDDCYEQERND
ncbi:MAG: HAMP domain-containing protein, partial [Vampirovibrionia bacterium]